MCFPLRWFNCNGWDMDFVKSQEKEKTWKTVKRTSREREAWHETGGRLKAKWRELTCEASRGKGSRIEREEAGAGCHLHFPAVAGRCFALLRGPGRSCCLGVALGFEWHPHINFSELICAHWRQKKTFHWRRNWNKAPMPDWQGCLMLWANNAIYMFAFLKIPFKWKPHDNKGCANPFCSSAINLSH